MGLFLLLRDNLSGSLCSCGHLHVPFFPINIFKVFIAAVATGGAPSCLAAGAGVFEVGLRP